MGQSSAKVESVSSGSGSSESLGGSGGEGGGLLDAAARAGLARWASEGARWRGAGPAWLRSAAVAAAARTKAVRKNYKTTENSSVNSEQEQNEEEEDGLVALAARLLDARRCEAALCALAPACDGEQRARLLLERRLECFAALLHEDKEQEEQVGEEQEQNTVQEEKSLLSEEERAELSALVSSSEDFCVAGGLEAGLLLLLRCAGVRSVASFGRSVAVSSRVRRWLLQRALGPESASWRPLYSSSRHGVGAAAFGRAVGCYPAATVLVVRATSGDVMGYYSETEWRSGGRFFGNSRSRVFTMLDSGAVRVFESTGMSSNYCYFHLPSSKAQLAGTVPDGVAVGGQLGAFRLHIDADFKHGECSVFDSAFASGMLAPKAALLDPLNSDVLQFEIAAVEVWGLGGSKAYAEKLVREQQEIKEAMKRRQVNRKIALGGDDEDGNVDMWLVETSGAHVSYVKEANHNDT